MNKLVVLACVFFSAFSSMGQELSKVKIETNKLDFNTTLSEIPAFADSGTLIYFQNKKSLKRYSQYYDLFTIDTADLNQKLGQLNKISLTEQLTLVTNYHEGPCFVDKKNNRIYITISALDKKQMKKEKRLQNLYTNKLRLIEGDYHNGVISNLIEFPFNNPMYNVGHAAYSESSERLYFASTKPGGFGKSDLYYTQKNSEGEWEEPVNLGRRVNSSGNEVFPTVKNGIIFFASNGQKKQTGTDLDLFYVYEKDIEIKSPEELEEMNTERDDFALCFHTQSDSMFGYFSSNRFNNFPEDDDIYSFSFSNVEYNSNYDFFVRVSSGNEYLTRGNLTLLTAEGEVLTKAAKLKNGSYFFDDIPKGKSYLLSYEDTNQSNVFSAAPNHIYPSVFRTYDIEKNAIFEDSLVVNTTEKLVKELDSSEIASTNLDSTFTNKKDEYTIDTTLSISDTAILAEVKAPKTKQVEKVLTEKVKFNRKESFPNIYFGFDSYLITEYSKIKLDKLITELKETNAKYVVLNSYTDSRGSESYNQKLSVKRALSCREYLVSQGVKESQIKYTGFGESNLVNDCGNGVNCPDVQHLLNRRIEFTLLYN